MIPLADLPVLLWPFLACLLLVAILGYLGVHVLARKVIFVDLAMAQIAALGAAAAMLRGHEPGDRATYVLSLIFTLVGAAVFAITRTRSEKVPHEATIGLVYAMASAAGILLADLSPHGAEEMKGLLQGSIVWVTERQVLPAAAIIACVGAFQFVFRRRFLLISFDPDAARAQGLNVRLWDFLFYLSFGLVITSCVPIAGVLLVFCFLIAPAVAATMFAYSLRARLILGWLIGAAVSAVGLLFSYDRPSGPTILCTFAAVLAVIAMGKAIYNSPRRLRAAAFTAAALVGAFAAGKVCMVFLDSELATAAEASGTEAVAADASNADPILSGLADPHPATRSLAAKDAGAKGRRDAIPTLVTLLDDADSGVVEAAAAALGALHATEAIPALEKAVVKPDDSGWATLAAASALVDLGARTGVAPLIDLAASCDINKVREAARRRLKAALPSAAAVPADAEGGLEATAAWWKQNADAAVFDKEKRVFDVVR